MTAAPGFADRLTVLHEVTVALSRAASFDELCRTAVELGTGRLEFDRLGLWFAAEDGTEMLGSYGTDERGQIRDERDRRTPIDYFARESVLLHEKASLILRNEAPLGDDRGNIVGRGGLAIAGLWDGERMIGYIAADNLLSGKPISPEQGEILRLFACAVGHLASLQRSEADRTRLAAIVDAMPDLVAVADESRRLTYLNRAGRELLGIQGDLSGRLDDLDAPGDPRRRAAIAAALECGSWHGESAIRTGDARLIPVAETIVSRPRPDGGIEYLAAVATDLSDSKRAQLALRESEELFRATFLLAPIGIALILPEGRFADANPRFCDILGYSLDELRRLSVEQVSHPDEREEVRAALAKLLSGELTHYAREKRCIHRSGMTVWTNARVVLRRTPGGEPRHFIAIVEDITPRRRAEARSAVFRRLGQQLNVAATPLDAARRVVAAAGELLDWDAAWLELWEEGRSHTILTIDLIDGHRVEIAPPDWVTAAAPSTRRIREQGGYIELREPGVVLEPQRPFGDASRASASLMYVPIRSRVQVAGVLSVQSYTFNAYTAESLETLQALADHCAPALERTCAGARRRELEEQLRQTQKMESIGRLAGGVAHDFNNMLMVVNGRAEMLLTERLPPARRQAVEMIRQAGERAAGLTRQLLAFGRKQPMSLQPLQVNLVVRNTAGMLRAGIGEDIELVTRCEPELPLVIADRGLLEQVLINLAVNARDAMPGGGRLTFKTRCFELGVAEASQRVDVAPGRYVRLTVSDTGCGMEPETMRHIFEPFFTTKGVGVGTGLGLSTVYGIIKQLGGHVEVDSRPAGTGTLPGGTSFQIHLPAVPGEAGGSRNG